MALPGQILCVAASDSESDSEGFVESSSNGKNSEKRASTGDQDVGMCRPVMQRRSHLAGLLLGCSGKAYRRLKAWKIPSTFLFTMAALQAVWGPPVLWLDGIEMMCGIGTVQTAGHAAGYMFGGYDIELSEEMDFLSDRGWTEALQRTMLCARLVIDLVAFSRLRLNISVH